VAEARLSAQRKTSYHHGNLRQALIDRAIEEVRRSGVEGLSLRGLALSIGVTPNAPYRHFSDLDAILNEVTAHAIECLHQRNMAALMSSADPHEASRNMAQAWLDFASDEEQLIRLAGDLNRFRDADKESGLSSWQTLLWEDVVAVFRASYPHENSEMISKRALIFTSVLYGYILMHKRSDRIFEDRTADLSVSDRAIVAAAVGCPVE